MISRRDFIEGTGALAATSLIDPASVRLFVAEEPAVSQISTIIALQIMQLDSESSRMEMASAVIELSRDGFLIRRKGKSDIAISSTEAATVFEQIIAEAELFGSFTEGAITEACPQCNGNGGSSRFGAWKGCTACSETGLIEVAT